jgi:hypothetical protein
MNPADVIKTLTELDPTKDCWFVRHAEDQLVYIVGHLPDGQKVCTALPTAIHKTEIKTEEKQ